MANVKLGLVGSLLLGSLLAGAGCAPNDSAGGPEDTGNGIDAYIRGIGKMPEQDPNVTQGMATQDLQASNDEYQCTRQNYSETRQYDKIVAFGANSDSMYPGAVVRGDSIYTGLFTQSALPRAPMTISVSHPNLVGPRSAVMYSPSISDYRETLGSILSQGVNGATDANIAYTIEQVDSEKKLELALGVKVSWGGGISSVASSFNWNDTSKRTRIMVDFTQSFFTVDVDPPSAPSGFFSSDVTLDEVEQEFNDQDAPLYVSSVTYGRRVIFTMETNFSEQEIKAALDFAFHAGAVNVSGSTSLRYDEILNETKITAFVLGGSAEDAVKIFDGNFQGLKDFVTNGANFDPMTNPGAPIAYKLNYMSDRSNARMSFTTDYENKECNRISQRIQVTLESISVEHTSPGESQTDAYGQIWAQGQDMAGNMGADGILFNRGSGEHMSISRGSTDTSMRQSVIINVDPHDGRVLRLHAHLIDWDSIGSDDDCGTQEVDVPFEVGWRGNQAVVLTGEGQQTINFSMKPI